jgi:hypothetical protein
MLDRIAYYAHTALDAAAGLVGVRALTEEPKYDRLAELGEVEIRRYGPRLAAETDVAGDEDSSRDEGFRRLAGYIFGGNAEEQRIAMTAPVAQAPEAGGHAIRFFLPAAMTNPPPPRDPRVRIVEVPAETVAVHRFSGSTGAEAVAAGKARLRAALEGSPWQPRGEPVAWFYDPPWTPPPLRRTEVAVAVSRRD